MLQEFESWQNEQSPNTDDFKRDAVRYQDQDLVQILSPVEQRSSSQSKGAPSWDRHHRELRFSQSPL